MVDFIASIRRFHLSPEKSLTDSREDSQPRFALRFVPAGLDRKRRFPCQQALHDMEAQGAIRFQLFLAKKLVARCLMRKGAVAALIIQNIVILVTGQRGLDVKQNARFVWPILDLASGAMWTWSGGNCGTIFIRFIKALSTARVQSRIARQGNSTVAPRSIRAYRSRIRNAPKLIVGSASASIAMITLQRRFMSE